MQRGLTLPELLIALVVFAILVGLAAPSFQGTLRNQELNSQTGLLTSSLAFARSEAIARRSTTSLCPSIDGSNCSVGTNDWSQGWLVYLDQDENGLPENASDILRAVGSAGGEASLVADRSGVISYNLDGERQGGITAMSVCAGNAVSGPDSDHSRTVSISLVGSSRVEKGANCP